MARIYQQQIVVPQTALDVNGHVNNVVYIQWMQDAAVAHSAENGCSGEFYKRLGVSWVARSHHIQYVSPAFDAETIQVISWLAEKRKASCLRKYRFHRLDGHQLLARAETQWVFVDAASGKPLRLIEEVISRFEIIESDCQVRLPQ